MVQCSFSALGTKWWVEIFDDTNEETIAAAFAVCEQTVKAFEINYSRFLPESFISRLNRERTILAPSSELRSLLEYGSLLYGSTGGVFNLLKGEHITLNGYDSEYSFIPKDTTHLATPSPHTDLVINEQKITLVKGEIDVGGYGKGYLIDILKDHLAALGIRYFLINGGGDMYATSDHGVPVEIYLEHPTETSQFVAMTTLFNQGFAASSSYKRQWQHAGITYAHIMSPQNEIPNFSTYVKAASAAKADAFATSALLVSEMTCQALSQQEAVDIARYTPHTNLLWKTSGF